jgi:putrescine transport system ATP-binding protein
VAPTVAETNSNDSFIRIRQLTKRFGDFVAVDHVDLDIKRGELFSILGSSGCGKSTLLRMMAGLEAPTSGSIEIDGVEVTRQPPYERPVNMMFQSYAIFPHMTVEQNIAYGLKKDGVAKAEIARRVDGMLDLVQLGDFRRRKPDQLSGGQRQRVAIARALVTQPSMLLADEPTGNLDSRTGAEILDLFDALVSPERTLLLVTHDAALARRARRLVSLHDGRLAYDGDPASFVLEYQPA